MDTMKVRLEKGAPPFKDGTVINLSKFNLNVGKNGVGKSILAKYITYVMTSKIDLEIFKMLNKEFEMITDEFHGRMDTKEHFEPMFIPEQRGVRDRHIDITTSSQELSIRGKSNIGKVCAKIVFDDKLKQELLEHLKKFNSKIIGFSTTNEDGFQVKINEQGKIKKISLVDADGFAFASFITDFINLFLHKNNNEVKVIFIEEPENHLTPELQVQFIKWLIAFCDQYDKILYVNSHSPYILLEFAKHYKNPKYTINYLGKEDEYTTISKITTIEEIKNLLAQFFRMKRIDKMADNHFVWAFDIDFEEIS